MPFPEEFATDRLAAERLRAEHADLIHQMHQNTQQMALLGGIRDLAQTADYMERNLAHWDKYGFGVWVLREIENGEVAGRALLRHVTLDDVDEVEVGYGFQPQFWGRGLATEIASTCLEYARTTLSLPSVVALTSPANLASQNVLTKIGMVMEKHVDHETAPHLIFRSRSLSPAQPGGEKR